MEEQLMADHRPTDPNFASLESAELTVTRFPADAEPEDGQTTPQARQNCAAAQELLHLPPGPAVRSNRASDWPMHLLVQSRICQGVREADPAGAEMSDPNPVLTLFLPVLNQRSFGCHDQISGCHLRE